MILVHSKVFRHKALRYYLTAKGKERATSYGICVSYDGETVQIENISPLKGDICRLLQRLADGCVTPIAVRDVVEDWLLE